MIRWRSLLSLIALLAFVGASFGTMPPAHVAAAGDRNVAADCPDHQPPPAPCPDTGTAKHAAGECCPLMAGTLALLPEPLAMELRPSFLRLMAERTTRLVGKTPTKDPPPPRV